MTEITIRPFTLSDAQAFHDLNMQWLTAYFRVEPKDTATLSDPQGNIYAVRAGPVRWLAKFHPGRHPPPQNGRVPKYGV